ncbi:MAG: hypothetical protein NTZ94_09055, partial [Verrucomicrobia bacterium]|nr:hypothetical protein [Verrucomicrobiota bacterium]
YGTHANLPKLKNTFRQDKTGESTEFSGGQCVRGKGLTQRRRDRGGKRRIGALRDYGLARQTQESVGGGLWLVAYASERAPTLPFIYTPCAIATCK